MTVIRNSFSNKYVIKQLNMVVDSKKMQVLLQIIESENKCSKATVDQKVSSF